MLLLRASSVQVLLIMATRLGTTVIRDICVDKILDEWTTVAVPPVCTVSEVLQKISSNNISVKGKVLYKLDENDDEILVSYMLYVGGLFEVLNNSNL